MTPCVEWNGRIDKYGYGRLGGKLAHRIAYEREVGPIPDGLTIDHLCFNKACVNVAHMECVTRSENSRRQRSGLASHCKNGHEYTPENTYLRPPSGSGGHKDCRTCIRDRVRKYKRSKRDLTIAQRRETIESREG